MSADSYPESWPRECCEIADRLEEREALLRDALAALRANDALLHKVYDWRGKSDEVKAVLKESAAALKRAAEAGIEEGVV